MVNNLHNQPLKISEMTRQRLLAGPEAGATHLWMAQIAGGLHKILSSESCFEFLRRCVDQWTSHREVPDREIQDAVNLAYGEGAITTGKKKTATWPDADPDLVAHILETVTAIFDVGACVPGGNGVGQGAGGIGGKANVQLRTSNVERRKAEVEGPPQDAVPPAGVVEVVHPHIDSLSSLRTGGTDAPTMSAGEALQALFKPDELLCCGVASDQPEIRPAFAWLKDAEEMQFIVPSPMKDVSGINKAGLLSVRCQSNVKKRRFLVAEFDDVLLSKADQAKLITALSRICSLKLVVDSAGKSLHAWFDVEGLSIKDQMRFFSACCLMGSDPTRWDVCGWIRMPGGTRPKDGQGVRQRVLFWASPEGRGHGVWSKGENTNVERPTLNIERRKAEVVEVVHPGTAAPTGTEGGEIHE